MDWPGRAGRGEAGAPSSSEGGALLIFVHADDERGWQVDALRRSLVAVGQDADLVVRSDQHPERWRYSILDRVLSFARAMEEHSGDAPVAICDPDMVVLRRLEPSVSPGRGQATRHQVMHDRGIAWQLGWAWPGAPGDPPLVDWPVVLHADDARRIAPAWLSLTERVVADVALRDLFSWMADMYVWGAAAHSLGITFDQSVPLRVVPGIDTEVGDAWVVHYHLGPLSPGGFWKRDYVPGVPLARGVEGDEVYGALCDLLSLTS